MSRPQILATGASNCTTEKKDKLEICPGLIWLNLKTYMYNHFVEVFIESEVCTVLQSKTTMSLFLKVGFWCFEIQLFILEAWCSRSFLLLRSFLSQALAFSDYFSTLVKCWLLVFQFGLWWILRLLKSLWRRVMKMNITLCWE